MKQLQKVIYSIENYQARTILELLKQFLNTFNEMVEMVNSNEKLVHDFIEFAKDKIEKDIEDLLQSMIQDGSLATIIGSSLSDMRDSITQIEFDMEQFKVDQTDKIAKHILDSDKVINDFKIEINTKINEIENRPTGINPSDIIDNLESTSTTKVLSANMGRELSNKLERNVLPLRNSLQKGFIAHRGWHKQAPENTLKAIRLAGQHGFKMCELDVRESLDGHFIIMHDETIDRTTNGTGYVANMSLTQLKTYLVNKPSGILWGEEKLRIPTLEEALQELSRWGMGINIDAQYIEWTNERIDRLYSLLEKYDMVNISFASIPNPIERLRFSTRAPKLTQCITTTYDQVENSISTNQGIFKKLIALKSNGVDPKNNKPSIMKCHELGIPVMVYEVYSVSHATQYLDTGVALIETDDILPLGGYKNV